MPSIRSANVFWIETGAMQGAKRYLLEIKEDLAKFFDEKSDTDSYIDIEFRGQMYRHQKFVARKQEHYSPQWRVFLPTEFPAFHDQFYPYRVAKFEKKSDAASRYYQLEIRDDDHSDVDDWKDSSRNRGNTDTTASGGGGREFGYY